MSRLLTAKKSAAEAADIIRFTRERIASFKTPKSIDFTKALPRNASGTIPHRDLRKRYWSGKTGK
jgi:acyl-coenzyme A synthetase/AMP-(fatty) acid ligase